MSIPSGISSVIQQMTKVFASGLNATQTQNRQANIGAWKGFESQLTPDQKAAQEKWQFEKMEGAPASQWQGDKQAFLSSLTPQETASRQSAQNTEKTFQQSLTPQQQQEHQLLHQMRVLYRGMNTQPPTGVSTPPTGVSTPPTGVSTPPTGVSTPPAYYPPGVAAQLNVQA